MSNKLYTDCPFPHLICSACFANTNNICDFTIDKAKYKQHIKEHIADINRKHFFKKPINVALEEELERAANNTE